jgi:SulP family sulfate permease
LEVDQVWFLVVQAVIVLIALMQSSGLEYVFAAVALAGVLQILVGLFKLGKFIRLVPQPVMFGFVNGLALLFLCRSSNSLRQWRMARAFGYPEPLFIMLGLVLLTIAIVLFFPKITKAVPASLVAIVVVFGLVLGLGIETKTVADIASISGGFPIPYSRHCIDV